MKVKDKRESQPTVVSFEDLPIGQVYEDRQGVLCIKTNDTENEDNCICFVDEEWESNLELLTTKVTPLVATLEIVK